MSKKVHFIINPVSGQPYPILSTINKICDKFGCDWSVAVTKKNNIDQLIREAKQSNVNVIAVYGGDGSVAHIAGALMNSGKIMGILPGGTANILSIELGIPQDIEKACELICKNNSQIKQVDVGQFGDKLFLIRLGFGIEAEAVKSADRTFKNQLGWLAYALASFKAIIKTKPTQYELTLDGDRVECEGLSLIVANSGNLGLPRVSLLPNIDISDGKLDVILVSTAGLSQIFNSHQERHDNNRHLKLFQHWQAEEVKVKASPIQPIHYDGEIYDKSEVDIRLIPNAVNIIYK